MSTGPDNSLKFPITVDVNEADLIRGLGEVRTRVREIFQQIINDWQQVSDSLGTVRSPTITSELISGKYRIKSTARVPEIKDLIHQQDQLAESAIEINHTIEEIMDEGIMVPQKLLEDFKKIKKAIKPLHRQNKIKSLEEYFAKGGLDVNDELQTMLGELKRSQARAEYKNILTAGRGRTSRSLLGNIKTFYKSLDRALNPELATEIQAKRRELEKAITIDRQKKQDQAFKDQLKDIDLLSPADQIARLNAMRTAAVASRGKVGHIDREIKKRTPKADRVEWNRILNLVNTTNDVARKLHWLNSIARSSNVFAPKAKERAFQISGQRDSSAYRKLLKDISSLPLQDQYNALQAYASSGAKHRNDALHEMSVLTERMKKADFADLFNRTKVMPISKQIDEFVKVLGTMSPETDNIIKAHIENLRKKLSSKQFKDLRTRLIGLDPDAALTELQKTLTHPNFAAYHTNEIQGLSRRLYKNVRSKRKQELNKDISRAVADERDRWESLVRDAAIMSKEDAIRAFESYSGPNDFMKRARNRAHKLKTDVDYQEFMKESDRIKLLDPAGQVREIRKMMSPGSKYFDKWAIRLQRSQERLAKDIEQARKGRWEAIERHILSKDDDEQIKRFSRILRSSKVLPGTKDRAKILLNRAEKRVKQAGISAERDKQRNFQNMMLNLSGIGLGLLGPAGFPLLNVGFSAMTGGMPGMIATGIATASGELYRAFSALTEQSKAAAKEIGFVGHSYKMAEARKKALDASMGAAGLAAEKANMEMLYERQKNEGSALRAGASLQSSFDQAIGNIGRNFFSYVASFNMKKAIVDMNPLTWFYSGGPIAQGLKSVLNDAYSIFRQSNADIVPQMREGLKAYDKIMMQGMPGIESDPYQTWLRIQNSALDLAKIEERQYLKEMRDILKAQLDMAEKELNAKKKKEPANPDVERARELVPVM